MTTEEAGSAAVEVSSDTAPDRGFWQTKTLDEMTHKEWELLCDGCGKCCLEKLEDGFTGTISYTNVACRLLNLKTCRCSRYAERRRFVPNCEQLDTESVRRFAWLPSSCAYRLLSEGKELPWWHPLVSGDPALVHKVGASVCGRAISERRVRNLEHHIVTWPA
jgi:uncharacterized cysteine cluster protein YcgN (CxxCxxCC family)